MSGEAEDLRRAALAVRLTAAHLPDGPESADRLEALASRLPSLLALADAAERETCSDLACGDSVCDAIRAYRAQLSPSGPEERPQ